MRLVTALIAAGVLAASVESAAEEYAIASLVGRQISLAYAPATPGSRMPAEIPMVPVAEPVFDEAALQAIAAVLRRTQPQRKIVWLTISDAAIVEAVKVVPSPGSAEFTAIVDPLIAAARSNGATRLIVVLPHRHDVMVSTIHGGVSLGKAAGVGVYFDPAANRGRADMPPEYGFLGVFANFRLVVFDAGSGRILATDAVAKGHAYSAFGSPDPYPFNAVPAKDKVARIVDLVRSGIEERLPAVLEKVPAS
jgi:hypothetical protein